MSFLDLNIDIHTEVLTWLDIFHSVPLLLTCKQLYHTSAFWRRALNTRNELFGPLSGYEGLPVSSMDIIDLRRVAYLTLALWTNWSTPSPRWKSTNSFHFVPGEGLIFLVPNANMVFSLQFCEPGHHRLRCRDLTTGRELCSFLGNDTWLPQHAGHQKYDEKYKEFTFAFITQTETETGIKTTYLNILKVDYANFEDVRLERTHRLVINGYDWVASSDIFRMHTTADSITMVAPLEDTSALYYFKIDYHTVASDATVRFRKVVLDKSVVTETATLLEYFIQSGWVYIVMKCTSPPSLVGTKFPVDPPIERAWESKLHLIPVSEDSFQGLRNRDDIFDIYDLTPSIPSFHGPIAVAAETSKFTICPFKVNGNSDKISLDLLPGYVVDLQPSGPDSGLTANTVAFCTHAGLVTQSLDGSQTLSDMQLVVFYPEKLTWSAHILQLPPEIDMDELVADELVYDLDQYTGKLLLLGQSGHVHVVSYV